MKWLVILALLFALPSMATDTPSIHFGQGPLLPAKDLLQRQCADQNCTPDLVDYLDQVGESIAICTHFNGDDFEGEGDPSILGQFDGVCASNGYLRYHVDDLDETLRLQMGNTNGTGTDHELILPGAIRSDVWHKACARIEVLVEGTEINDETALKFTLDLRADDQTAEQATTATSNQDSHNWLHMTAYGLGKGIFDNNGSCYANAQVHQFVGQIAAWVVVANPTEQDITDYLAGYDPEVIWNQPGDLILNPLLDATTPDYSERAAEGGTGIDWFLWRPEGTSGPLVAGETRTFTEASPDEGVCQGIKVSWLENVKSMFSFVSVW